MPFMSRQHSMTAAAALKEIRGPITLFNVRFEECCIGGNCYALRGVMPCGTEVLITAYNEACLPTRTDWSLGFYDADGDMIALNAPGDFIQYHKGN